MALMIKGLKSKRGTPEWHQERIARDTIALLSDAGAAILGPPSKAQARETLKRFGWSEAQIANLETP